MFRRNTATSRIASAIKKPFLCSAIHSDAFFVSSAARLAALAVTSDARTVPPPAFAAAYSFLMARFCCQREYGLLCSSGFCCCACFCSASRLALSARASARSALRYGLSWWDRCAVSTARTVCSAASSSLCALSTPTLSSSCCETSRCTAERTALPGASRTACCSLDAGRGFSVPFFIGIFASACFSFSIRFAAFFAALETSGTASSSSVNCSFGARLLMRCHLRGSMARRENPTQRRSRACGYKIHIALGASAPCAESGSAAFPDARRTYRTYSRCVSRRSLPACRFFRRSRRKQTHTGCPSF